MSPERPIAWLGKQKEKRALSLSKKHMDEIVDTVESMKEAVQTFAKDGEKFASGSNLVFNKEKEADKTKANILNQLSKGNFPPMSREKIIRLLTTADDIADNARAAAMKLTFVDPSDVNASVKDGLKKLAELSFESSKLLKEAFLALLENPENAIDKTEKVEKIEEKIDFFRAENLTPKMIKWADKSHKPGTSSIINEVEGNIEEVADQAENCADAIREIAIGSV